MMDIYDVQKALQKGINNTLHQHECDGFCSSEDCWCGAEDDKREMRESIDYLKRHEPLFRLADFLNWPLPMWDKIYNLIQKRFDRADIPK